MDVRPGSTKADAEGVRKAVIDCWPTAYRFKRGHKLRLIVASGAHPRNLGGGELLTTATAMATAQQAIMYGSIYNASLNLSQYDVK